MTRPSQEDALRRARREHGAARWDIRLPSEPPVSGNRRIHWSARHRIHAGWQNATMCAVKAAGVPPLPRCWLLLTAIPPDRRRRDSDNLIPHLLKPIRDGVVAAGVVRDDTDEFLPWALRLAEPDGSKQWGYRLTLSESLIIEAVPG